MKYILLILLLAAGIGVQAQPATTDYDTSCPYLNRYTGEWMSVNGTDTIRIYLRVHKSYSENFNLVKTRIWGWHEYKQGNTIVESNYQHRFMQLPYYDDSIRSNQFSIFLQLKWCDLSLNTLVGSITDYSQASEGKHITALVNPTGTSMTWKQRHEEGYGVFTGAYGMTLPKEFVLVKQ
jgi:hypothetical protein